MLIVLSPLLVVCWIAIRLTSRGPAIYRSVRPGIGGRPFDCLKFRTMHDDAEQRQEELEVHNEAGGAIFKIRQDPRVTTVGRILRRWSIDELPQLFCVLAARCRSSARVRFRSATSSASRTGTRSATTCCPE